MLEIGLLTALSLNPAYNDTKQIPYFLAEGRFNNIYVRNLNTSELDNWLKDHPFLKDAEEQGNKLVFTKEDDSEGYAIIS